MKTRKETMKRLFPVLLLAFLTFGMPRVAEAQVTVAPFLTSNPQFLDGSGSPLNSGCVFTYAAGTTTPLVTYSDSAGSTPNSNPVLLNSGGFPQSGGIWLTAAAYKFVVKTTGGSNCSTGSTITTTDGITWSTPLSTFSGITSTGNVVINPATAATGGANQSSPTLCIQGFYFNVTSLTDQWCLSNVLGTGASPASTFTLTHSGSGGASSFSIPGNETVGGTLGVTGALTAAAAKNIGGVQYAAQFAGSSTTCGVAEAYAALPSSGGEIVLQQGNCSAAGWPVTIQKPILLVGQGMGGTTDPGTNAAIIAGSSLTNTSTGNSFFVLSLGSSQSVEGITFRDFAMIGNKVVGGATAGDCVDLNGGTTAQQLRAISFENIQCNQPKGSGFVIKDNAFMLSFYNVHVDQAGSHCLVIKDGVVSGIPSQIHIFGSTFDLCGGNNASFNPGTADGINVSGSTARTIDILSSTAADSNNGINVVAGATNTSIHVFSSDFESNTNCDISLNDGLVHRISSSTLFGGGTFGLHGVCTNMPAGAAIQQNQLFMDGNWFGGHTSQDVLIGANQKTGFILPQNSNIYTYSDASNNVVKLDVGNFAALQLTGLFLNPTTNGSASLGTTGLSWNSLFSFNTHLPEFTAPSAVAGQDVCYGDSTAHALECSYNNAAFFRQTQTIGTGTVTTAGTAVTNGTCQAQTGITITGSLTSDQAVANINAALPATWQTGIRWTAEVSAAGTCTVNLCNGTAGSITPAATSVRCTVTR